MNSDPNKSLPAMPDGEPVANRSQAPVWLIGLFALLFYWGAVHLDDHGGGFSAVVYWPYHGTNDLFEDQPVGNPEEVFYKLGEKIFSANCAVCHQPTGLGSPLNGCPPLVGSEWVIGGGPNRIIRLVLNGGIGPISVRGQPYPGTTPMTPFKDNLSDEQIAAALSYVRNTWGNKADFVKPDQVGAIRRKVADKPGNWTSEELLKIPDKD
ncbi:MAG TPA: cytochrome c [Verrucomicrobiae bacterium]|nr:cytochrome c [Verrucomicrobiae bacterium]